MKNKGGENINGNSVFNISTNTYNCIYANQKNRKAIKHNKLHRNNISMHAYIQCIYFVYPNIYKNTNNITYSKYNKSNPNNNNINPNIQEKRNTKI